MSSGGTVPDPGEARRASQNGSPGCAQAGRSATGGVADRSSSAHGGGRGGFPGLDTVAAVEVVAGLHDVRGFHSPRELMAYLGLEPSEHSSGGSQRRGSITKAGISHVRRVSVETAWHYRHAPAVSKEY